jgi:hypothetical protein
LAFQLTGPGSKGEARQRTLNYALANAARKRTEQNDSFGDTGAITHTAGLPQKQQSRTFDQVGMYAPFGEDAAKNPGYFEEWTARHLAGPGMNFGPQPGPSA